MARNVKVPFQGKTIDGRAVEFDTRKETWNEYVTEEEPSSASEPL